MKYRILFVFLEGPDDKRLFQRLFQAKFEKRYSKVVPVEYAEKPKDDLGRLIKAALSGNHDYIFLTDINASPCVSDKKEKLRQRRPYLAADRIAVVQAEIESWYLAGLDRSSCKSLRLKQLTSTDTITKEQFDEMRHGNRLSRTAYLSSILDGFSIKVAKSKNRSFRYFAAKYHL